ncbi:hypothetical protein D6829_02500 [Candidatus Pacearchaeota archaeon]|nr:MAG: hypothetical protein D6829_02500 [Candidatus Pacearchaeota archaeon]
MFKKILVVESGKRTQNHRRARYLLKNFLQNKNLNIRWILRSKINRRIFGKEDLVITLGGDGTFLLVSHFVNSPIIGINSDKKTSEGRLCSLSSSNIPRIKEIFYGNYIMDEKTRAEVVLNNHKLGILAINEVYVGSKEQFHTSRYVLSFRGKSEEQRSSGVLISTGTGSTAWYHSAGGKPFNAKNSELRFLVREPFFGKLFRPKILSGRINKKNKLKITSKMIFGGIVAIDGLNYYPFGMNRTIEIHPSEKKLLIIRPLTKASLKPPSQP